MRWLMTVCQGVRARARQIRARYRRREGSASGQRLMEQVRARTTSPTPALRSLLIGVGLVIVRVWIGYTGCICAAAVKGQAAWHASTLVWNG